MAGNYCPSCGTDLDDDPNFCPDCGEPIDERATATAARSTATDANGATESQAGTGSGSRRRRLAAAVLMLPATLVLFLAGATIQSGAAPGPGVMRDLDLYHWFGWPILVIGLLSLPLTYGHAYAKRWAYRLTRILYGIYLGISLLLVAAGATMGHGYGTRASGIFNLAGLGIAVLALLLVRGNAAAYD